MFKVRKQGDVAEGSESKRTVGELKVLSIGAVVFFASFRKVHQPFNEDFTCGFDRASGAIGNSDKCNESWNLLT